MERARPVFSVWSRSDPGKDGDEGIDELSKPPQPHRLGRRELIRNGAMVAKWERFPFLQPSPVS